MFLTHQVTALMHPVLLERASAALLAGGPGVLASALTRTELALLDDVWRRLTALATLAAEVPTHAEWTSNASVFFLLRCIAAWMP